MSGADASELIARFGPRLRELRARAGLTQAALAERCGTRQSAVAEYECGTTLPSWPNAVRLALALGVPLGAFVAAPSEPDAREHDTAAG